MRYLHTLAITGFTLGTLACVPKDKAEQFQATVSQTHGTPSGAPIAEVVTGRHNVETIFPSQDDLQLLNLRIRTSDSSGSISRRKVTTHYVTLSVDRESFLEWFHKRSENLEAPYIVMVVKHERVGMSDTFTGYRRTLDVPSSVEAIVLAGWIVEGVQYNPPVSQNPAKEVFIADPLSQNITMSLNFDEAGRLELDSEKLKADYEGNDRSFSLNFSSMFIPRHPPAQP